MAHWKKCETSKPEDTEEVLVAAATGFTPLAAQYVADHDTWYRANSSQVIATPVLWREYPDHPFAI